MGFCLFNNIAVAAAHALAMHGLERVAIADFDVHHGNGTQAIFEHDPRVLFASSHQSPLYPGHRPCERTRRRQHPQCAVAAAGATAWHSARRGRTTCCRALDAFRPQLLLVSAGFDAHRRDPLAQLATGSRRLRVDHRASCAAIADRHARGRIVSTLEGGYDLQALRECSVAHVGALLTP